MCNDYGNHIPYSDYLAAFSQTRIPVKWPDAIPNLQPRDDIWPTDKAPVVRRLDDGTNEFSEMRWGFPPAQPKRPPVINFRSEGRRFARLRRAADPSETQVDPSVGAIAAVDGASDIDRVSRAFGQLEERYQEVLLLVADSRLTYDEVARALDIPVGTVRSRLSRGRQQLRELLNIDGQLKSDVRRVRQSTEGIHE